MSPKELNELREQDYMRSQTKWGIALMTVGAIISPLIFPLSLIYSIPLILIGIALILFRKREEKIEEV